MTILKKNIIVLVVSVYSRWLSPIYYKCDARVAQETFKIDYCSTNIASEIFMSYCSWFCQVMSCTKNPSIFANFLSSGRTLCRKNINKMIPQSGFVDSWLLSNLSNIVTNVGTINICTYYTRAIRAYDY